MNFGFISSLGLRAPGSVRLLQQTSIGRVCARRARVMNIRMSTTGVNTTKESQGPTIVRARHILVESEEMIDAIKQQLDEGKGSFEEIAKTVSTCTSKTRGGDLGWFRRSTMVKEFEDAAFSNPPGTIVKLKSDFGWHLLKVEDHGRAANAITVKEFDDRFGENGSDDVNNVQLIDVREIKELEKASLPRFLNLPMGEYGSWADEFDNGGFNLEKDKETIVMCHHGVRSANFCSFLGQQGFTNVRNLIGGIDAYAKKIDPSVPLY